MGFDKEVLRPGNGQLPQRGEYCNCTFGLLGVALLNTAVCAGQHVTVHCTGFGKDRDLSQKVFILALFCEPSA